MDTNSKLIDRNKGDKLYRYQDKVYLLTKGDELRIGEGVKSVKDAFKWLEVGELDMGGEGKNKFYFQELVDWGIESVRFKYGDARSGGIKTLFIKGDKVYIKRWRGDSEVGYTEYPPEQIGKVVGGKLIPQITFYKRTLNY